jgi:hypothetical protein
MKSVEEMSNRNTLVQQQKQKVEELVKKKEQYGKFI